LTLRRLEEASIHTALERAASASCGQAGGGLKHVIQFQKKPSSNNSSSGGGFISGCTPILHRKTAPRSQPAP
jgi:hypothetical protein